MTSYPAQLEPHRPALLGHCYRMLGSVFDADDAVQETMIRAWRAFDQFDAHSSLKAWLYRIATNVCLDELKARTKRALPIDEGSPFSGTPPMEALLLRPATCWIEPILDAQILPAGVDPAERAMLLQSVRLAFVAALQKLPPKQRAALLLAEIVGYSVTEIAETLDMSVAAVNSALQRARVTLAKRDEDQETNLSPEKQQLLTRYLAAFEQYDVDALTSLMRQDAKLCMPPYSLWLKGPEDIRAWMLGIGSGCCGSRLTPISACGWPAFVQYRPNSDGGHKAWALIVLELFGDRIAGTTSFLDVERLFPRFGWPLALAA